MCEVCGCSDGAEARIVNPRTGANSAIAEHGHSHDRGHGRDHDHDHGHDHGHDHDHTHDHLNIGDQAHDHNHDHSRDHDHDQDRASTVALGQAVLKKNNERAERNRAWFAGREILALNLVSSPGAGKTTLLERTIGDCAGKRQFYVIEGDQETANDSERIAAAGAAAVQVNTGTGCHLEADMVARGLKELAPPPGATVIIENVGNLVCPALFDLGEQSKVVVISVTEGEDKPLKYPHMFQASDLVLVNKIDLLPHLRFDLDLCLDNIRKVNPRAAILQLSAVSGEGLKAWYDWIEQKAILARQSSFA